MSEKIPQATHSGILKIGELEIPCYVLENKERVLSTRGIMKALGRRWRGRKYPGTDLPVFLEAKNLKPFIDKRLDMVPGPRIFKTDKSGLMAEGFSAEMLPVICDIILEAREQNVLKPNQFKIAERAEILSKGLRVVGIIALVDEATGYQDIRVKNALEKILNQFLLDEAKRYQVTFPLELYKQWFRLNNWEWREENAQKRPSVLGKWTNNYIYSRMAPNLLKALQAKNPKTAKGYRKHKHFQFLTDEVGEPKLREYFGGHIALAKATTTWRKYISMVEKVFPKFGENMELPFPDNELDNDKELK